MLGDRDGAPDIDQGRASGTHGVRSHCGEGDRAAYVGRQTAALCGNNTTRARETFQTPRLKHPNTIRPCSKKTATVG